MSLAPGTRLGPYEILAPIGAGGMGEVYRARDGRLDRDVAIKILPAHLAGNADARARFEREAKAVAALSHPNILALHDIGAAGDIWYSVAELLEGTTLAERLAAGPLAPRKAIEVGLQVARGLAAAHDRGFVHRDLKPANIFLTGDGLAKILDFGLARGPLPEAEGGLSRADTRGPATAPGTVLGTYGYMAPEQVRGLPVDARSDLFAFGAVLYEMLSGRRAFVADTAADTLSAILREEPEDLSVSVTRPVPPALDRVVRHCLEKNPAERFQSARDLIFSLEAIGAGTGTSSVPGQAGLAAVRGARRVPLAVAILGAAAALLVGGGGAWLLGRAEPTPPPSVRQISYSGTDGQPSASADGKLIAFTSTRDGTSAIWLRQHPGGDEIALTTGAQDEAPRISPDGTQVLFARAAASRFDLYRIPVLGGEPRRVIADAGEGDWSPDGRSIVFVRPLQTGTDDGTLVGVINADGDGERTIARFDRNACGFPRWSPDGRRIVLRMTQAENAPSRFVLIDADGSRQRVLEPPPPLGLTTAAAWVGAGDFLVYGQHERFTSGANSDAGRVILQEVATGKHRTLMWAANMGEVLDILGEGQLLLGATSRRANLQEVPLDGAAASGAPRWRTRGQSVDRQPVYSPDGAWVMFSSNRTGNLDLWRMSTATGAVRRITEDAADDWDPAYLPDGSGILWSSSRGGHFEIWTSGVDGTGARQLTRDGADAENPTMTPDGRWVIYNSSNPEHSGLWKIHPDGTGAARLLAGSFSTPDVSPDGRFIAFRSLSVPRALKFARVEDGAPVGLSILLPGGNLTARPRWMPDGKRFTFTSLDAAGALGVYVQDFDPARDTTSTRRPLIPFDPDQAIESVGVAPDGSRAILSRNEATLSLILAEGVPGIRPPVRSPR